MPSAALFLFCALAQGAEPPKEAECKDLAAEYLSLGPGEQGAARRAEILARLDAAPALTAPQARAWAKRIAGLLDGEKLVDRGGLHQLADGRSYYLGGKANRPAGVLIHLHGGKTPNFDTTDPQAVVAA